MTTITFPLTERQAVAVVVAAERFGVEPWEIAVHVLSGFASMNEPTK